MTGDAKEDDPLNELLIFLAERGDGCSIEPPTPEAAVAMERELCALILKARAIDTAVQAERDRADKAEKELALMRDVLESGCAYWTSNDMLQLADNLEEVVGSMRSDAQHYETSRVAALSPEPPTPPTADQLAERVRERCAARGLAVDRKVTDAEGGRALILFGTETLPGGSHRLLATITCDDDGDITILVEDRLRNAAMEAWTADDIDESLDRIAKHLRTPEPPTPGYKP